MFRVPLRRLRPAAPSSVAKQQLQVSTRRTLFTKTEKKGTWRGTALRWGLAGGAVYWYNTSPMFADDAPPLTSPAPSAFPEDEKTVDAVIEEKRKEIEARAQQRLKESEAARRKAERTSDVAAKDDKRPEKQLEDSNTKTEGEGVANPAALEDEADQQGAFNPETGEINWDCPCLGGMASGPCGEEFRAAFSCFVYSKEEPKGMDCIDKFQAMQDCFRAHPDVYGDELEGEEVPEGAHGDETPVPAAAQTAEDTSGSPSAPEEGNASKPTAVAEEKPVDKGVVEEAKVTAGKSAPAKAA